MLSREGSPGGSASDDVQPSRIEGWIIDVGRALTLSLEDLVRATGGDLKRPSHLVRSLGINKDLASKLLLSLRKRDPLAALYYMPGPEALFSLTASAEKRGMGKKLIAAARRSIEDFEALIRKVAGDRAGLNAIISAWVPDARARFELANKQGAFKYNANLKGVLSETAVQTFLLHPPRTGDECIDVVGLPGFVGIRRIRPGARLRLYSTGIQATHHSVHTNLDGEPFDRPRINNLVPAFCTAPLPELNIHQAGKSIHYLVGGDDVGISSAATIFFADLFRDLIPIVTDPANPRRVGLSADVEIPSQKLIFDVLMHHDVWPGAEPELCIYDATYNGAADVNDPARDVDRMDMGEVIQNLGNGISGCRTEEISNYVDLLRFACDKLEWNPDAFRCYRCFVKYPYYGAQYMMVFDRPLAQ